ncbi:MAG: H+transporting two-sector ATPase C subunit [Deltaproteobacteria bacterium]|nr:H+transporting two-sector ATPase C subunit [Deltaproteobacteria bacterium]
MAKDNLSMVLFSGSFVVAVLLLFPDLMFAVAADAVQTDTEKGWTGLAYISAALAVGLSCIGSAYAVARIGSAGLGAVSEKPELTGRVLVFLGLAEGIAIYGLIIAIMILNKL